MHANRITLRRLSLALLFWSQLVVAESRLIKTQDTFTPPAPNSTTMTGRLGEKLDRCVENRLLAQNVEALVRPYREKKEIGSGDWRCEYWGKWFTSMALADAYRSTSETRAKLEQAAAALMSTAAPDGYLGTRVPEHRLKGWDVWGRKYALLGLLAFHDRTRNPEVLKAACRHADTLLDQIGPGKMNIADIGEHKGLAASSVLEPVVLLYQRTGESKYLQFAEYIVEQWSKPSKTLTNGLRLIEDALAGTPPEKMTWNKAYEMMSCFEGLCELFRVTGERRYADAASALVDNILKYEVTVIGAGTQVEHWFGGTPKQAGVVNRPMETCVTATWMKLLYQVLRITGEPRYADELEKNLYNGLLGAMMPDGSWWAYFSAPMGERVPSDMQHEDVGLSCCVVNGPRGLMLTPFWAVMTTEDGPVINLCAPNVVKLASKQNPIEIQISGDYPVTDTVEIVVRLKTPEEFTVALRIPGWSKQTEVRVNGRRVEALPGSYARLRRQWRNGDVVRVRFDFRGRVLDAPDGNGHVALARGPVMLALDDRLTPAHSGAHATLLRDSASLSDLKPNPKAARRIGAWMAFDVPFTINGKHEALTFCDFLSAGTEWREGNRYRTWLPQPLDLSTIYETGQTWQLLTHRPYRPAAPPR